MIMKKEKAVANPASLRSDPTAWKGEMPPGIINGWNTWKEIHRRRGTPYPDQVSFPDHPDNREKSTDKFGSTEQLKMKLNGNNIQLCTHKVPILQYCEPSELKNEENEIFLSDFQTLW